MEAYRRTSLSLLQQDRITLALLLVRATPFEFDRSVLDSILDEQETSSNQSDSHVDLLIKVQQQAAFKDAKIDIQSKPWQQFMGAERAETIRASYLAADQ